MAGMQESCALFQTGLEYVFQRGNHNQRVHVDLRTYVRIWSSGVFQCGKTYSSRKFYVRTYVYTYSSLERAKLEHCGELSGIRICIFRCKLRVDWKWKIVEWKVVAFLFVYTVNNL